MSGGALITGEMIRPHRRQAWGKRKRPDEWRVSLGDIVNDRGCLQRPKKKNMRRVFREEGSKFDLGLIGRGDN